MVWDFLLLESVAAVSMIIRDSIKLVNGRTKKKRGDRWMIQYMLKTLACYSGVVAENTRTCLRGGRVFFGNQTELQNHVTKDNACLNVMCMNVVVISDGSLDVVCSVNDCAIWNLKHLFPYIFISFFSFVVELVGTG